MSCAVWPDFAFASAHSKMSKLLGMTMFLLPVTFVMPKMICGMNSMLFSNVHAPSASFQTVPNLFLAHHVQCFDRFNFMY
eukprot:1147099-Pelagomonas_calceolata.AAC.2